MERKTKFVPIAEASTKRLKLQGVTFPPFVDTNKIGVNTRYIERLMDIGGINTLTVQGVQGDTSSETPTVVGMTEQGGALAGKKSAKTIMPIFEGKGEYDAHLPAQFRFVENAQVLINVDEVSQRLQNEKKWKDGVRSVSGWSHHVDKAITEGVEEIGTRNLVTKGPEWRAFLWNTAFTLGYSVENLQYESLKRVGLDGIGYALFINIFMTLVNKARNRNFLSHASLIYGPQLDRALILKAAAKTGKVVKEIPPQKIN
jgi:hypothetical protein